MSKIAVVYWSGTGNTEAMANAVLEGVQAEGAEGVLYTARWFSGVNYQTSDPWPERTRFADDADFQAWLSRVMSENIVPSGVKPPVGARLLVCSTCSDDYPPCNAYAALAAIEEERPT